MQNACKIYVKCSLKYKIRVKCKTDLKWGGGEKKNDNLMSCTRKIKN